MRETLIEAPCLDCPPAMAKFCGQLLDRSVYSQFSEAKKEEFGYDLVASRTGNRRTVRICLIKNENCPMSIRYLDWVLSSHSENGEISLNDRDL